jgi:hypothetical protein
MRGLRKYLENSNCNNCKKLLREVFFTQNNVADSIGGQATEPATDEIAEGHSTDGIKEHSKI